MNRKRRISPTLPADIAIVTICYAATSGGAVLLSEQGVSGGRQYGIAFAALMVAFWIVSVVLMVRGRT